MASPFQPLPGDDYSAQPAGTSPVEGDGVDIYGGPDGKDVNDETQGETGGGSPLLGMDASSEDAMADFGG